MHYQASGIGYFPLLKGKIKHAFTWGPKSQNMSKIVGVDRNHAEKRVKQTLEKSGITARHIMLINPNGESEIQILKITYKTFKDAEELQTYSNFVYTTGPNIAIMVKPGDCPVGLISAVLNGHPVVGLLHAGRKQLDEGLPFAAIQHLIRLGCNPEKILIGITPSISKDNYYISLKDKSLLKNYNEWKGKERLNTIGQTIHLDLLGYLIDQLVKSGVKPDNIQAYDIDTFSAVKKGEGFSHRYASFTKNPNNNGRFLVAVQI